VAAPEVLELLTHLVDKSLVVAEEGSSGEERYRLLETIRQYAGEKLSDADETAAVRDRHASWFLAFAEQGAGGLAGPAQEQWLERLEIDHDNLRAALDWIEASPDAADAHLRLVAALSDFWLLRGHLSDGDARIRPALAR